MRFYKDGKTVYFTQFFIKGAEQNQNNLTCKLLKGILDGKWINIAFLSVNNKIISGASSFKV
jgi:hypothetical protein